MKYDALVYNKGNPNPIGEVKAISVVKLKQAARTYSRNFNNKSGKGIIEDKNTLKRWDVIY